MEPVNEIATALAKAQAEMSNPKFDTQNPFFKNRYASLAAVRDAVIPVFARHQIAVVQDLQTAEGSVACSTILTHSSGQQMKFGPYTLPVTKPDAQGYGSASTYARRYHLMAVAGVVGDSDDDAEAAVGRNDPRQEGQKSYPDKLLSPQKRDKYLPLVVAALTAENGTTLRKLMDELNDTEWNGLATFLNTKQKAQWRALMQVAPVGQDMIKAGEYADRFRAALALSQEDLMAELHTELSPDPNFYIAVSTFLTPAERDQIKAAIHRVHGNGRATHQ